MAEIRLNSTAWTIYSAAPARGVRSATGSDGQEFPREFLTAESEVAEQFVAEPRSAPARGQAEAAAAPLDFSYDLEATETAILALRHPSGALTFHLPVQATLGLRGPNQVRFSVTVRSADVDTATRTLVSKVVKATLIKVAKFAADKVVSYLLPDLARAFEEHTWAKDQRVEGWVKITPDALRARKLTSEKPTSAERSLLLIHGTFSYTGSAYADLANTTFFDRLRNTYADRIFGFDHFTVSRTPEENARMLLEGLPEIPTTFDVVTHSRGGLVLRNLMERTQKFDALGQRFKLGQAVLVASPNDGTPLATPTRWAETVGWVANLLELFPDNPFTTGAAFVGHGLVWIARHAAGDLPGLQAMDGAGEMIADLQSSADAPLSAYSALVANYQPDKSVLLRMVDTGVDQFFATANDLVVPSEGGWHIGKVGKYVIPGERIGCYGPGGNLPDNTMTHVGFFKNELTAQFLVRALLGERQPLPPLSPEMKLPDHSLFRDGVATAPSSFPAYGTGAIRRPVAFARQVPPSLKITVVNADLAFEKNALLLGHYESARLTGTERVVDELIGGSMKLSLNLGLYPQSPGVCQVFMNAKPDDRNPLGPPMPRAVIVAGLGAEGKLNAAQLTLTVRQAVLAWSQRMTEVENEKPEPYELSATLLSSGGTGMVAGQAAQRIARGVYEANELMEQDRASGVSRWPRVSHLQIVELYLDRATEAWRALKLLAEAAPDYYSITDEVKVGTGALYRPLESGYRGADYDFITVRAEKDDKGSTFIRYTLDTRRARSEVQARSAQPLLLRDLVATASTADSKDKQIGLTLFRLLIPIEMEAYLGGSGELQIELDQTTAAIPWELLDAERAEERKSDRTPWSIRTSLLRKLRIEDYRRQVVDASTEASVLVIGEPECPREYPRLRGAWEEANKVYETLMANGLVDTRDAVKLLSDSPDHLGPNALAVINAVLEREWRIIHVAGHGEAVTKDGSPGGVVLSNGSFLGASEIAGIRNVPELVFINCCYLAASSPDQLLGNDVPGRSNRVQFASGVAEELIKIGVRCVIAAGWAVSDVAAQTFAGAFYQSLLAGNRFITAVARAREEAYKHGDNTWAAYQCYGDPDWVFQPEQAHDDTRTAPNFDEFADVASESALKLVLKTLVVQSKSQHCKPEAQLERIRKLERRFAWKWGAHGRVAELFADAYVQARDLGAAILWYEKATSAEDGKAGIRAAERLANVRARHAAELVEKQQSLWEKEKKILEDAGDGLTAESKAAQEKRIQAAADALKAEVSSAREQIRQSTGLLDQLTAIRATMERENYLGSAYKRLALVERAWGDSEAEIKAIEAMKVHYEKACKSAEEAKALNRFYPILNYLAADLVLRAGGGAIQLDQNLVDSARRSINAQKQADPDFWSFSSETELCLYEAVAAETLANSVAHVERKWRDLHARVSAPAWWSSVYDTGRFVLQPYIRRVVDKHAECDTAEKILAMLLSFAPRS